MIELLGYVVYIGLLVMIFWLMSRHWHRWSAWSAPIDQPTGYPLQSKHCRDTGCNKYKMRRVA